MILKILKESHHKSFHILHLLCLPYATESLKDKAKQSNRIELS